MNQPLLQLEKLHKSYSANGPEAVSDLSLSVNKGELVALVGASGSGKTTLLRLIAGFEQPDRGCISMNCKPLADDRTFVTPENRNIGMVFQDYALFPHLKIDENIAYGLHRFPKHERGKMLDRVKKLVGLSDLGRRYPHELSGGQQQRVALARALAPSPAILLMDEPFSNLDEMLKDQVRQEIKSILHKAGTTAIFVTHDTRDALATAERIAILKEGILQQFDSPLKLYNQPKNRYTAQFFGKSNFLEAYNNPEGLQTALGTFHLPDGKLANSVLKCTIMFRPEHLTFCQSGENAFQAEVKSCAYYGENWLLGLSATKAPELPWLQARFRGHTPPQIGQQVHFQLATDALHILD